MKRRKRNQVLMLSLSLRFAKEYFKTLCEMQKSYNETEIQESKELTIIQRALWTSLIIEIGRLLDPYNKKGKKVISFKQLNSRKTEIDKIFKEDIIQRIRITRCTFTAHLDKFRDDIISIPEICSSNLNDLLNQLNKLLIKK